MIGFCMFQNIRQVLSESQKQDLKLILRQELRHPDFPNALKGFEGMLLADSALKSQNSIGLLVGSLSRAVWNRRVKEEDLEQHYDVDVMVMNESFYSELGIDWFLPRTEFVKGDLLAGDIQAQVTYVKVLDKTPHFSVEFVP